MSKTAILVAAALALMACDDRVSLAPAPAAATVGACEARATAPWRPLRGVELRALAETAGVACAGATATLTVTDASGRRLYMETLPVGQVMTLAAAEDSRAMQVALSQWIDQTQSSLRTTSELPVWIAGADQPTLGEFPFYPEAGVSRDAYTALRRRDAPLFCFVQGMESMTCLALVDDTLTKVGVQTFPG